MTDIQEHEDVEVEIPTSEASERGRYAVYPHPSGQGMIIARSSNLCDRCLSCGCGDRQDEIDLSIGGLAKLAAANGLPNPAQMFKSVREARRGGK